MKRYCPTFSGCGRVLGRRRRGRWRWHCQVRTRRAGGGGIHAAFGDGHLHIASLQFTAVLSATLPSANSSEAFLKVASRNRCISRGSFAPSHSGFQKFALHCSTSIGRSGRYCAGLSDVGVTSS